MAIRYDIIYLIITAFVLAFATTSLMKNTIPFQNISDADRYISGIQNGTEDSLGAKLLAPLTWSGTDDFITKTNFLLFLSIGYLVYSSTKSWKITLLTLLGFSVSLLTYFTLLAQAIVIVIGLFLWTKVEPKGIKNNMIYLILGIFAFFTHKLAAPLIILIYLLKRFDMQDSVKRLAPYLAAFSYVVAIIFLVLVIFPNPERVSFFYFFLLPISMGAFDGLYWMLLFGLILWMLSKCENNTNELLMVSVCFLTAVAYVLFISHLEIDFWRLLLIGELFALIKIGQSEMKGDLLKYMPWVLIAIGVQRLIIGLIV
jgi:hypothetical protein